MAWDGNGSFSRTNGDNSGSTTWAQDAADGDKITAARHDSHDQDLADGIEACLTLNGENEPSAHLQWLKDHYWGGTSGGTANAQTVTMSPAPSSLYTGMRIKFIVGTLNTGATTLNPNGLGATAIKAPDGDALIGGELPAGHVADVVYNGTNFLLLNPYNNPVSFTPTGGGVNSLTFTVTTNTLSRYTKINGVAHFETDVIGTTGGSAGSGDYVTLSLPFTLNASFGNCPLQAQVRNGSSGAGTLALAVFDSTTSVKVWPDDTTTGTWTIGTNRIVRVKGWGFLA